MNTKHAIGAFVGACVAYLVLHLRENARVAAWKANAANYAMRPMLPPTETEIMNRTEFAKYTLGTT